MWQLWALAPESGTKIKLQDFRPEDEVIATRCLIQIHNMDREQGLNRALVLVSTIQHAQLLEPMHAN